ncbi:hypothetical protein MMC21_000062 [Puttea exsequens]|nr:hypothetical protein [Puttea exsequens]
MVAFAVGGLLGDTLFHLLPEIFLGEAEPTHARFVLVEPNKNLLLGVAIMVGFVTFVAMDKGLRIATGGDGGHDHSHGQKKEEKQKPIEDKPSSATASGAGPETPNGTLTTRNANHKPTIYDTIPPSLPSASARKFRSMKEPKRAHYWLEEVLEEDADSGVTQIALWKAYETALVGLQEPPLEAKDFIHSASKVFAGASAAVLEGSKPKFIIKGVKPRRPSATAPQKPPSTITTLPLPPPKPTPSTSVKLSAYLNLIADFTHNITDGLAMSSSFYASPTLGATTAVAVFFHEIPHEVGDFALLVQSGFSKRKAMGMQFVTALGALLGTCIGIVVQELGKAESGGRGNGSGGAGLAGTGLRLGDMLLPFTAGTFLYVGTVAVIPELLEMGPNKGQELRKTLTQFVAMAAGAGIMFA